MKTTLKSMSINKTTPKTTEFFMEFLSVVTNGCLLFLEIDIVVKYLDFDSYFLFYLP